MKVRTRVASDSGGLAADRARYCCRVSRREAHGTATMQDTHTYRNPS